MADLLSRRSRAAMVAMGYVPLGHAGGAAAIALAAPGAWRLLALVWLLLLPPLVVRLSQRLKPVPGQAALGSPGFLRWWWQSQWQVLFNRIPQVEEAIRLVPGLYAQWIRLWGSRVDRFVYWTPGLRILDRQLVDLGHGCTFGAGVSLNPHVIGPHPDSGAATLLTGPVRVGEAAVVGAESRLLPGCWVAAGQWSPPRLGFRPHTGWENGRRVAREGRAPK